MTFNWFGLPRINPMDTFIDLSIDLILIPQSILSLKFITSDINSYCSIHILSMELNLYGYLVHGTIYIIHLDQQLLLNVYYHLLWLGYQG